jgi:hypothetical protein
MRFRPANIRLINRRSKLLRLLLALPSNNGKSNNNPIDVQGLTGSLHIRVFKIRAIAVAPPAGAWIETRQTGKMVCAGMLLERRYSRAVDTSTGLRSDHTAILTTRGSASFYPGPLRRVTYCDLETGKRLKF